MIHPKPMTPLLLTAFSPFVDTSFTHKGLLVFLWKTETHLCPWAFALPGAQSPTYLCDTHPYLFSGIWCGLCGPIGLFMDLWFLHPPRPAYPCFFPCFCGRSTCCCELTVTPLCSCLSVSSTIGVTRGLGFYCFWPLINPGLKNKSFKYLSSKSTKKWNFSVSMCENLFLCF